MSEDSKIIRSDGYRWKGVERKDYKTDTDNFRDIHRYSILGEETSDLNTHMRYFELQPGGYSSLEQHWHTHSVMILRGSGTVVLNNRMESVQVHDVIYISPDTIHQFHADSDEPLGFLCMVDCKRDKPEIPDDETIKKFITDPKILKKIRK